jgi:hypothetical protein
MRHEEDGPARFLSLPGKENAVRNERCHRAQDTEELLGDREMLRVPTLETEPARARISRQNGVQKSRVILQSRGSALQNHPPVNRNPGRAGLALQPHSCSGSKALGSGQEARLLAAPALQLYRRTFHRAVRAEDAAISHPGAHQSMALDALVEEPARVDRHLFQCRVATVGTSQHRFQRGRCNRHYFLSPP